MNGTCGILHIPYINSIIKLICKIICYVPKPPYNITFLPSNTTTTFLFTHRLTRITHLLLDVVIRSDASVSRVAI